LSVSRSIGLDTKTRLMTATKEQLKIHGSACNLCKYVANKGNSSKCHKCLNQNDYDQYYG